MADTPLPVDPAAAAASPAAAPVAQEALGTAAPAAPIAAVPPAAAEAPAQPEAPAVAVPDAAAAKSDEPKREPTLLEKADAERAAKDAAKPDAKDAAKDAPKPDAKPDDKPAADAAKPEGDAVKPETPPAVEYKYELPDTLKMDDAQKGEFKTVLDEFRADPVANAQKIIDFGAKAMNDFATQNAADTIKNQFKVFNETKQTWETKWLADTEIGGAGHQTAMQAIARARDNLISSARPGTKQYERDRAEFEEFIALTGAGSHPAFGRMLHNAARFIDEPQATSIPTDIKPPKGNGRPPKGSMYSEESRQKMNGAS